MKKMLIRMLALVLALSMNLGLAQAATDMAGREVTLQEPARRVVVLTASDVEILYALGAGDTLAGRGEYANYPLAALDVPSVQSGMETNIEQIIALEPDLVTKLHGLAKQGFDERIYVRGDRMVDYGRVASVMSTITSAGFKRVALVTEPAAR